MTSELPTRPSAKAMRRIEIMAIPGLPDFAPGDNLARALIDAARNADLALAAGDVIVVAQKVVSKCAGAYVDLSTVEPGARALHLAEQTGKDPRLVEVVLGQSDEVLRARPGLIIVAHKTGHVMANAGVDRSNIGAADSDRVLLLPADADQAAATLRTHLELFTGLQFGVVINDSWGRAWRNGTTGHAVGVAGIPALWDRRGEADIYGKPLRVTEIGVADEIAAAASIVMGAAAERQPVVIVRGLSLPVGDGRARDLVRDKSRDLFR
jgi:coenzyme F420-0:L-glutamate ligase/coenzyme F420-1:gamma-L-glutamate ligase